MTLMQHFRELKGRVVWSLIFFCASFILGLYVAPLLRDFISGPLISVWAEPAMIYTGISDGLSIQFSLAGLFAIFTSSPLILFQIWRYVSPALNGCEKKAIFPILVLSPLLFLAGAAFSYFIFLPIIFRFFLEIGGADITMLPDMKGYLSFSVDLIKAFGFAFQFPLVLVILNRTGTVSKKQVLSVCRYIIVGIFVLSAILTPPDVISQIALALPLIALFGLSFLFMI
jgi:sec-independent protein translocase protein TatC